MLTVAIDNLVSNAWKYTGKTTNARICFRRETNGDEPVFVLSDNGPGFDEREFEKIFLPFFRTEDASQFEGDGVGLATVRKIIERHGGRITAHRSEEGGAEFRFTLPPSA